MTLSFDKYLNEHYPHGIRIDDKVLHRTDYPFVLTDGVEIATYNVGGEPISIYNLVGECPDPAYGIPHYIDVMNAAKSKREAFNMSATLEERAEQTAKNVFMRRGVPSSAVIDDMARTC